MKRTSIFLLPVLLAIVVFATGCFNNNTSTPVPVPTGTFGGTFKLLRRKVGATVVDTLKKANIQLVLETGAGYKVLGDTATVHAGSKGPFGINATYIAFDDTTYPKTGNPPNDKIHLYGSYFYNYDGTTLVLLFNQGDTLNYRYDFKRIN
ncbi:hypothetical protein [Mucilaginibacter glaciei]|uniref:Uncharacterized protein n=1 Tax=Mucilaginibacter glaciei TaxID=2772109 RepID=A0A926NR68_9SPHI|nr:hypothetical protein [Mucilaginibacter glaciei]MBD1394516.1 hypothetical protein [Mucilaginibacter glaciei]